MRNTLTTYLEDYLKRGDEIALVYRQGLRYRRWSYREVAETAFRVARYLEQQNVTKGDRIILWADNSAEWVSVFWGIVLRGAVVIPLDVQSEHGFVSRVKSQVEPKLVICDRETVRQMEGDASVLLIEDIPDVVRPFSKQRYEGHSGSDDLVEIVFTSGTTAEPKGVCLSHRNILANLLPIEDEVRKYLKWERLFHPIRFLTLLPLSHVFGQFMGIFTPQLLGGEVFFLNSLKPSEIISTTRDNRISVIAAVPRLLDSLRDHIEDFYRNLGMSEQFSRKLELATKRHPLWRWWMFRSVHGMFGWKFWAFVSGGAALDRETEEFWLRLGFAVIQGYGMTETASLVSVNHPFKTSHASIGKLMAGQQIKLGENGEILIRGENVTSGYWNAPESALDEEGWLHTGDLAEMDPAGNLFFKGRKKDVIVTSSGMNVYPEDIEVILNRQPEIRASAVIPFEGRRGHEPLAALIMADTHANADDVIKRVNSQLAEHQKLSRWVIWPETDFPRTSTGKIQKQKVAAAVISQLQGAAAEYDSAHSLGDLIERISGAKTGALAPSTSLMTDLKLDSVGRVELLSALEDRYQVEIDEAAFTAATTVGDVERMIGRDGSKPVTKYPYANWPSSWPFTWIRVALYYILVLPFVKVMGRPSVVGKENLAAVSGPVLLVSNHVIMSDHALIMWALPPRLRFKMAIAMDGEILSGFVNPPERTSLFLRARLYLQYLLVSLFFNVFPMPQKSGFRQSFNFAGKLVDKGFSVLVFPEGRRTDDGKLQEFKKGAGLLIRDLNLPVIPFRLDGLFELKERLQYFAGPGQITVRAGKPVEYKNNEDAEAIVKDLRERVASI